MDYVYDFYGQAIMERDYYEYLELNSVLNSPNSEEEEQKILDEYEFIMGC